MQIDILSLFPEMFISPFAHSIIKRAIDKKLLSVNFTNPRDYTYDRHHQVDDVPFGGGAGMVLKPEPFFRAVTAVKKHIPVDKKSRTILLSPEGTPFSQDKAKHLATYDSLIFICGHYEGFDNRISEHLAEEKISIGDYVLTGGELACMVIVDAVSRMLPNVLGSQDSAPTDSFYNGLLEHPQYTRPRQYKDMSVPDVLLSGNHAYIDKWRQEKSLETTYKNRPDLLDKLNLSASQRALLEKIKNDCT